jgi:hypothetical protein
LYVFADFLGLPKAQGMIDTLGNLLYSKGMPEVRKDEGLHNTLRNFTWKKLQGHLKNPFFILLLRKFNNMEKVDEFTSDEKLGMEMILKEADKASQ